MRGGAGQRAEEAMLVAIAGGFSEGLQQGARWSRQARQYPSPSHRSILGPLRGLADHVLAAHQVADVSQGPARPSGKSDLGTPINWPLAAGPLRALGGPSSPPAVCLALQLALGGRERALGRPVADAILGVDLLPSELHCS